MKPIAATDPVQRTEWNTTIKDGSSQKSLGFTLVELLSAVVILTVLVVLLLSASSRAKETSNLATCASNLRQIGMGVSVYLAEHNQKMPPPPATTTLNGWLIDTVVGVAQTTGEKTFSTYAYVPHGPTVKAWICPGDPSQGGLQSKGGTPYGVPDHIPNVGVNAHSYLTNALLFNRNMTEIPRPAQSILASEYPWWQQGTRAIWPSQNPWKVNIQIKWHNGKINCLFVDGHVETLNTTDLVWGKGKFDYLWYSDYPTSGATEKL